MLKERKCLNCGQLFVPKNEKNVYHNRRCFKQAYYKRQKKDEETSFPIFRCEKCGQQIILDFHPTKKKDAFKWVNFKCLGCHTLMIEVFENIITKDEHIIPQ